MCHGGGRKNTPMLKKQLILTVETIFALLIVEILVLVVGMRIETLPVSSGVMAPAISVQQFLFIFLISTAVLLFLIKTLRHKVVFEGLFILSTLLGIWLIFTLISPSLAFVLAISLVALRYIFPLVIVQNIIFMLGIAGVAAALGSATPWQTMAIVLAVLAVYDIIAVYGTRHMVTMFKGLLERGVIFALVLPERPAMFFSPLNKVQPGAGFFFLGSGDIALPAIFVASAFREGFGPALGAAVGSVIGLALTTTLFAWGKKRPMPALPPISLGTVLGFFVALLVKELY